MTLDVAYNYLNFEVNKVFGTYYAPGDFDLIVDRAQMSLYNDYYMQFGASQRLNDAMAPFKRSIVFTESECPTGLVQVPSDYEHLLSLYTITQNAITGLPYNRPVPILNEDEKVWRDNNQIYPPSLIDPYGIIVQNWNVQLYPAVPQAGVLYYLNRPPAPKYVYSVVSGRVIVYDPINSVQLAWADKDQNSILIKALSTLGINVREQDVIGYAESKSSQNLEGPDKI
jgi:hypothetical protein